MKLSICLHYYKSSILFLLLFLLSSCTGSQEKVTILIENTQPYDRLSELVEIPILQIQNYISWSDQKKLVVINSRGEIIPSQITYNGLLIFESGLKANSKEKFTLQKGDQQKEQDYFVDAKFRPDRKGDFSWENNRVGFRFYGKELMASDGPSNGLDLFLKRTDKLVLDKWYYNDINQIESYHEDHGEGCDPYSVGRTLGAGACGLFVRDSLYLNDNYESYEILDEGPLRTTFVLRYPSLILDGEEVSDVKKISLDINSQLSKIEQSYQVENKTPLAVGIVKRSKGDSIVVDTENRFMLYQEPEDTTNGVVYVGVIIPSGIDSVKVYNYDYVHPISGQKQKLANTLAFTTSLPVYGSTYYAGYGWSKYGFENMEEFLRYLRNFSLSLKNPLQITFNE